MARHRYTQPSAPKSCHGAALASPSASESTSYTNDTANTTPSSSPAMYSHKKATSKFGTKTHARETQEFDPTRATSKPLRRSRREDISGSDSTMLHLRSGGIRKNSRRANCGCTCHSHRLGRNQRRRLLIRGDEERLVSPASTSDIGRALRVAGRKAAIRSQATVRRRRGQLLSPSSSQDNGEPLTAARHTEYGPQVGAARTSDQDGIRACPGTRTTLGKDGLRGFPGVRTTLPIPIGASENSPGGDMF